MNTISRRMHETSASVGDAVRANPLPLALIGAGVGWLLLSRTGARERLVDGAVGRRAAEAARGAREHLSQAGEGVLHAADTLYDRAGEEARQAAGRIRGWTRGGDHDVHRSGGPGTYTGGQGASSLSGRLGGVSHGIWDLVDEHPLVAGVMGLALGAGLGAAIPSSRYEDRWIGDYSDEAYEHAKQAAQDALDRGTRVAQSAYGAARGDIEDALSDVKNVPGDAAAAARVELDRP